MTTTTVILIIILMVLFFYVRSEQFRVLQGPYIKKSYLSQSAEHNSGLAGALSGQAMKVDVSVPPASGLEGEVRSEMSKRMERMTSPNRNSEDPLVHALYGHSVLEAL